jgi:LmbE family N-acetylglucosaminyl deacetylase
LSSPSKEILRLAAVAVIRLGLRFSSRPYKPAQGGMLVVAPHADDETLGCGGLVAAQASAGRAVAVVFLTDSAGSHPGHPALSPRALAEKRRGEARAALAVLGVRADQAHYFNLPDGTLDRLPPAELRAARERLIQLIRDLRPAEIFTPFRGGGSTEHTAAWELTQSALAGAGGGTLLEYPIWAWWNPLRLRGRLGPREGNLSFRLGPWRAVKRRALACHRSQVLPLPPSPDPALPMSLARACCGPREFFFATHVPAAQGSNA